MYRFIWINTQFKGYLKAPHLKVGLGCLLFLLWHAWTGMDRHMRDKMDRHMRDKMDRHMRDKMDRHMRDNNVYFT